MSLSKNRQTARRRASNARLAPKQLEEFQEAVGERIRDLRTRHAKMTLQQFATAIGTRAHGTVSQWEQGKNAPPGEALYAMHRAFGISVDWLLGVEGAPKFRRAAVQSPTGRLLDPEEIDHALWELGKTEIVRRSRRANDPVARKMRHAMTVNSEGDELDPSILFASVPRGLLDVALSHFVERAETAAKILWKIGTPARVFREVKRVKGEDVAHAALLGARLAVNEYAYGDSPALDRTELQKGRQRAWAQARFRATSK